MYPYNINDSYKSSININSNEKKTKTSILSVLEDKRLIKLLRLITEEVKQLSEYYSNFYKSVQNSNRDENTKESIKEIYIDILKALKFLENIYFMSTNEKMIYNNENLKEISNNFNKDLENGLFYIGEHSKNIRDLYTLFTDIEVRNMLSEIISDSLCDMSILNFIYIRNCRI